MVFHGFAPAFDLRQVAPVGRFDQRAEGRALRLVAHHDDMPALPVAAARREARVVENALQNLVGHGNGGEIARRKSRPHGCIGFHQAHQTVTGGGKVAAYLARVNAFLRINRSWTRRHV